MVTDTTDRVLPIKVDPTSNGEFRPVPLAKTLVFCSHRMIPKVR